jgi:hypothetical protein
MRQGERQKRHVACTLVAAVALVVLAAPGFDSRAAQPASGAQTTKLQVTARVAAFFRLQILYQAQTFTITQLDVDQCISCSESEPAAKKFTFSACSNSRDLRYINIAVDISASRLAKSVTQSED